MDRLIYANALRDKLQNEIDKAIPPFDDVIGAIRCGVRLARNIVEDEPTIDAVPLDGSFLKMSKGDYLIYNRHWLYEHFDQEMDIQRSVMKSMGYEPALKDAEPHWIPVSDSEHLPKGDGLYLTTKDPYPNGFAWCNRWSEAIMRSGCPDSGISAMKDYRKRVQEGEGRMKSREEETDDALEGEWGEDRAERELYEIAISLARIVDMLAELMKALETDHE